MEKAIEIKRRAQRCVQNGDLDGALNEYEKLVASDDSDPYNYVLIADLLYKKGDQRGAAERYLSAGEAYEKAGLYKNGIAVCKKMVRLSLGSTDVLERLASLHARDGLSTESALYYMQYAERLAQQKKFLAAAEALRKGFEVCPDNIRTLERLAEVQVQLVDKDGAAKTLVDAAVHYRKAGDLQSAERMRRQAEELKPGASAEAQTAHPASAPVGGRPVLPHGGASRTGEGLEVERSSPPAAFATQPSAAELPDIERGDQAFQVPPRPNPAGGPPRLPVREPAAEVNGSSPGPPVEAPRTAGGIRGLRFDAPATQDRPTPPPPADPEGLTEVEKLLSQAQEYFRAGDRRAASTALSHAAQAYEALGRLDSAATIYRSLGKSAHASNEVMELWLSNCERRKDLSEAAQVACDLGDRALNNGDSAGARGWFERAVGFDPANEMASRRLQRMVPADAKARAAQAGSVATAAPETPAAPVAVPEGDDDAGDEGGRVEVAVGRGEAVTFDLGSLINEFQRGVEAQLSGDAQSHYDLAMAYREMGLLEQAVDSFRVAALDPAYIDRCAEMIGRCLLDQGRFDDAAQEFSVALEGGRLDSETANNLRYQLGLAHEAAGRVEEALAEFENVYAAQASYPDVALKIRVLRKTLEGR
ncbi:MAG: hypothetical protein A2W00_00780 [Candidatus Eisenbacteria bacterium RBG_16_71_46]|nr:MAG: hypothetical protein A2W00_00780 [Candidatus Eisenbacteria bacterium RBG_16_71_46]